MGALNCDYQRVRRDGGVDFEMNDEVSYSFKASAFSAPWEFKLKSETLEWRVGRRAGSLRYNDIRRVRLSFRPVTMQSYRFQAEIWCPDVPKISIASASWQGLLEQARQDETFTAFVVELHRRMTATGTRAKFLAGMPIFNFWFGIVFFLVATLGLAALSVRALQLGEWKGAAVIGGFFALFAWQVGNYFRRNWPGVYRPEEVPVAVLPAR
jgi:hypothetical protein